MKMAIAAKRSLGVHAKFIGDSILTTGMLAYVLVVALLPTTRGAGPRSAPA